MAYQPRTRRTVEQKPPKTTEEAFARGLEEVARMLGNLIRFVFRSVLFCLADARRMKGRDRVLYLAAWPVGMVVIAAVCGAAWPETTPGVRGLAGAAVALAVASLRYAPAAARMRSEEQHLREVVRTALNLGENWEPDYSVAERSPGGSATRIRIGVPHNHNMANAPSLEKHFIDRLHTPDPTHVWGFDWKLRDNTVDVFSRPGLPTGVPFDESVGLSLDWQGADGRPGSQWHLVPLGVTHDGPLIWNLHTSPHGLFCGTTGTGKSVAINVVIATLMARGWTIWAADPKETEFFWLQYRGGIRVALSNKKCWELLIEAHRVMEARKKALSAAKQRIWTAMPNMAPMMVIVDEAFDLLAAAPADDEEKQLQQECRVMLASLARLGRAPGVHLLLAAQRPDAKVLQGELRNNLRGRMLLGEPSSAEIMMFDAGALPPTSELGPKGRGFFEQIGHSVTLAQIAYASDEQLVAIADRCHPLTEEPPDIGLAYQEPAALETAAFGGFGLAPPPAPGS